MDYDCPDGGGDWVEATHPEVTVVRVRDEALFHLGADEEALALLKQLSEHVVKPEFQYHHKWRVGDVLMWDNCAVQHVVNRDYEFPPDRRMMHRVTVGGSVPY